MIDRLGYRSYQIFILSLLVVPIVAPDNNTKAQVDNLIALSSNFNFTSNYTLYDINNNGLNDTLELTININWTQNFTYDIRILINFNEYSSANTYLDHILEYTNANEPSVMTLNYRWFSNNTGDILVKISLFQVGAPEQTESFVWESADKLQLKQDFTSNYEFSWDKNDTLRNFDFYNLELTLDWQNIVFVNSVEINVYEFIIPSNRYLLDRSTTQQTYVFGNGSSIFKFNGTRNSDTNKLIQIEVISQDFEPLELELLWEINPATFTVVVTNIVPNTRTELVNKKSESSGLFLTRTRYYSLITISILLTTLILRKRNEK